MGSCTGTSTPCKGPRGGSPGRGGAGGGGRRVGGGLVEARGVPGVRRGWRQPAAGPAANTPPVQGHARSPVLRAPHRRRAIGRPGALPRAPRQRRRTRARAAARPHPARALWPVPLRCAQARMGACEKGFVGREVLRRVRRGHLAHSERGGSGSGRVIVKIRDHFTAVCR